jgi:3-hydroxyisobutyrate dehydrogenase
VGFIGLGNMGRPMAANLARSGRRLVVRDVDAERQKAFATQFDAVVGDTPTVFGEVDAVVTMLPTGEVVRKALLDAGVASALPRGAVVIDTSSSDPLDTLKLGSALAAQGLSLVDAPVSGGMARALDGTLTIMLGADDEAAAERAVAVLEPMSARVFRMGGLGTGHAMKALNNFVLTAGFAAAVEALIVGGRFGLDPAVMLDVLNASSGRNVSTETTLIEEVLTRRFAANFTLGLLTKDLGIAARLADSLEIDAPLCAVVHERLARAGAELGWQTDYTETVRLWERLAGIRTAGRLIPGHQSPSVPLEEARLKVNRGREADTRSTRQLEGFTGEVWADPVLVGVNGVGVNNVFFAPRARTHWHRHDGGQILCITAGSGRVVTRDEGVLVRAGDVVWTPPGEEHWHGADEDGYLVHMAVSLGKHEWLTPVTDDEYEERATLRSRASKPSGSLSTSTGCSPERRGS